MTKKIIGMGNAVLDILAPVTDEFLISKKLIKGSMTLVDQNVSDSILKEVNPIKKDSGGSVANTIVGISLLGMSSSFCGKVKKDQLGDDFIKNIRETGTNFLCNQSTDGLSTARCIIFITPDGERSMQTFLGASTTLNEEDIQENFFDDSEFLLIEGYLWNSATARKAIEKAIRIAISKNVKIVFSLSDFNLVNMFKKDFLKFINSYVDILIGNELEFRELFEDNDKINLNHTIADLMVKTRGEKGVEISQNGKLETIPSVKVDSLVDTTGAGDMFAAGFLYKLLNGLDPVTSAKFGCKMASIIIQQYGARPSKELVKTLL